MPSPDQLSALKANRIDFGFVRLPIDDRRVVTQTVLSESFVVAIPEDHPLAELDAGWEVFQTATGEIVVRPFQD